MIKPIKDLRLNFFSEKEVNDIELMTSVLKENDLYYESLRLSSCGKSFNTFKCKNGEKHSQNEKHDIAFPFYCELRICVRYAKKTAL